MRSKRTYILGFQEINTTTPMVGSKGANLGELSRIADVKVPEGFCITTEAYEKSIEDNQVLSSLLDQLTILKPENRKGISDACAKIRKVIEAITIPKDIEHEIIRHLERLGDSNAYAIRSSAMAEDLPTASFAGQQDTYLNIIGKEAILKHVSKCWASLFTDRAVTYRMQNGFNHRTHIAVVVQKMVFPKVAGILFTADPITSNRKVLSIDASFGLGETLVSGLVNADRYKVREGKVIDKKISIKKLATYALQEGGTKEQEIEPERQTIQALTDEQILQLERIARKIEEHFGCPQDIEWCLCDQKDSAGKEPLGVDISSDSYRIYIVQSRPITTLYPIPRANDQGSDNNQDHIYISVGHQQMMTDAMKPLGLSFWLLATRANMRVAGGRLFVDFAPMLASPDSREAVIDTLGQFDPLIKDAVVTILERGHLFKSKQDGKNEAAPGKSNKVVSPAGFRAQLKNDPTIASDLIMRSQASLEVLKQIIQTKSGLPLFDFILEDLQELKKILFDPQSHIVIMGAMDASAWLNEKMKEWLGEKNAADIISQSVPNNITSEMGLALLDVADVIRPYPEVIDYLQRVKDDSFLDELVKFDGGQKTKDAIQDYLNKYGMRCSGEIDITKARWSEKPMTLVPLILSNIKNFEANASRRKFEQGRQDALKKEQTLLARLAPLQDGEQKAKETKQMIDLIRNFAGYREYPKYSMVSRYFVYKQALLKEAERLLQAKVIHEKEDIYYLSFEELREVVRTNKLDYQIISERKVEYQLYEKLTPPRVITSDGETVAGEYKRKDLPSGAIAGLPVSSGQIEGRARVILNIADADLEPDDILVTTFTDPSWTPLFVSIKGLVTEVGGLMTHGSVIAREYGLPAVVGVEHATKLIKDGQRIRVNGTDGYVEML